MAKKKSAAEERAVIVGQPDKRPYGVRVRVHVQKSGALGSVEEVSVPLDAGPFIVIGPGRSNPWEGGKKYVVTLEGFSTAAAAEAAGRRLVQALLWMAVSTDAPLRLDYRSYTSASVYERNRSAGVTAEAYGEVSFSPQIVLGELYDAYATFAEPDERLQLSMEIFCAARLEASQRAVFLLLVSALEPLAKSISLGNDVEAFVDEAISRLKQNQTISADLRSSLEGRLGQLKQESIRQALRRFIRKSLPDDLDAVQLIDDAYSLRSQLVHDGLPADLDTDLERESIAIAQVTRKLYAAVLGRKLSRAG